MVYSVPVSVHPGFGNESQRSMFNCDSHSEQWLCEGKIYFVFNFWNLSQKQFDGSSMTPLPICGLLYSRVTCELRASGLHFPNFESPPSHLPTPLIRESEVCGFSCVEKSHPCEKMLLVIPPLMSYPSDVNIYHECVVRA